MKVSVLFKVFCILLFATVLANAKGVPMRPQGSYVYDENRMLSAEETRAFNIIAEELYQKTGVGIAAALFKSIDGEDPRDFAVRIANSWKIGSEGKDGILIFVTLDEKRRSVETGYNVEAILPDALVERIQQKTLVPSFRRGEFAQGILLLEINLAKPIADYYKVELDLKDNFSKNAGRHQGKVSPFHIILLIFALVFLLGTPIGRQILMYAIISSLLHGGSSRRSHGGRGGFGGGFGGGSFGGGGSGGSW